MTRAYTPLGFALRYLRAILVAYLLMLAGYGVALWMGAV